ncbi:MAG: hypothetical protein WBP85_10770 [Terracidiphilus sp.]
MPLPAQGHDLAAYYCVYLAACAILIVWRGAILHRAGALFLNDAFQGNQTVAGAVARLLDIGFYLVSAGYVALTYQTMWPVNDFATVAKIVISKIGGLMLLMGVAHVFNLLLLALFRQRRTVGVTPAAGA